MDYLFFAILGGILVFANLIFIPIHVRYLEGMQKEKRNQIEQQEERRFEEELLHYYTQTNFLVMPSMLTASLIVKMKNKKT